MSANSEARKRAAEDLERVAVVERRREVLRDALAAVYSGAGFLEADALADQLEDRGAWVEVGS